MDIRAWHVISTLVTILIFALGILYYVYFPPKAEPAQTPKTSQTVTQTNTQK